MTENMEKTIGFFDKFTYKMYDSFYTLSIAKEATQKGGNSGGIIIIGMIIVIVGLIGFILTKGKK